MAPGNWLWGQGTSLLKRQVRSAWQEFLRTPNGGRLERKLAKWHLGGAPTSWTKRSECTRPECRAHAVLMPLLDDRKSVKLSNGPIHDSISADQSVPRPVDVAGSQPDVLNLGSS